MVHEILFGVLVGSVFGGVWLLGKIYGMLHRIAEALEARSNSSTTGFREFTSGYLSTPRVGPKLKAVYTTTGEPEERA